jgi:hypothetical protein
VYLTRRALFTADECAAVVAEAEAAAAVNSTGGWSTARHYSVPTTDTPLHALPRACLWFNAALRSTLAPMLAAHFPRTVGDAARVRTAMCESCEAARGGGEMGPGRGTTPKLSRRACRPRHGLRSWRRKSTGVAKQPLDLISHPKSLVVRFATFTSLYAAGGGAYVGAGARRVRGQVRRSGAARAAHALRPVCVLAHAGTQPTRRVRRRWHLLRIALHVAAPRRGAGAFPAAGGEEGTWEVERCGFSTLSRSAAWVQVVSFSGALMHQGSEITEGYRYIIAAFLYVDED